MQILPASLSAAITKYLGYSEEVPEISFEEMLAVDQAFEELFSGEPTPYETLQEMTGGGMNGFWAWKIKQMKKQIAEQTMTKYGITSGDLATMSAGKRVQVERVIIQEVEEALKLAISEQINQTSKESEHKVTTSILDDATLKEVLGSMQETLG